MDKINDWNLNWDEYVKNYKLKILHPISKINQIMTGIVIIDGTKREIESYFGFSQFKIYEITLEIQNNEYTFFKKILTDDDQEITRWRYENTDSLEVPIEHFFLNVIGLSKKDSLLAEEIIENFSFVKMINSLDREKVKK